MTHDTYENCLAERVNGILKDELVQGNYASFTHALEHVVKVIKIYNQQRPHLSLDISRRHKLIRRVATSKSTG